MRLRSGRRRPGGRERGSRSGPPPRPRPTSTGPRDRRSSRGRRTTPTPTPPRRRAGGSTAARTNRRRGGAEPGGDESKAADASHAPKMAGDEKEGGGRSRTKEGPSREGRKYLTRSGKRKRDDKEREEEKEEEEERDEQKILDSSRVPKKAKNDDEKKEGGDKSQTIELPSEDREENGIGGGKRKRDDVAREEKEGPEEEGLGMDRGNDGDGDSQAESNVEARVIDGSVPKATRAPKAPAKAAGDDMPAEEDDGEGETAPVASETPSTDEGDDDARKGSKTEAGVSDESGPAELNAPKPAPEDEEKEEGGGKSLVLEKPREDRDIESMAVSVLLVVEPKEGARINKETTAAASDIRRTGARPRTREEEASPRKRTEADTKAGQTPRDVSLGSHPMEGITTPGINDFLLSRNSAWDLHLGNTVFQDLVKARKRAFLAESKPAGKRLVAKMVVQEWRLRDLPGRFLSYDKGSGTWQDVGDKKAVKNAGKMLRDAVLEYSAENLFVAAIPPVPLWGATRPSEGETGAQTRTREEEAPPWKRKKAGVIMGKTPPGTALGSRPMEGITTPGMNDFLLSWGPPWVTHRPNAVFRAVVKKRKGAYIAAPQPAKWLVRREIIQEWRSRDPPGRFLSYNLGSGTWRSVGDEEADKMVAQILWEAIYEYGVEKGVVAAVPPVPPAVVAQPGAGGTSARTERRKEPVVIDLSNSNDENEGDATLYEAMFSTMTKIHQSMLRGEFDPKQMARASDLLMNAIRQQREDIVRKDAGIAKLNDLHNEMMAEKDAQISRMENEIGNLTREEVQEQAAGQLQILHTMKLQMCTIDWQRKRINHQVREAIELGELLAATTEEKDREIRRLRDEVARAKAEGREAKAEADREESEAKAKAEGGGISV